MTRAERCIAVLIAVLFGIVVVAQTHIAIVRAMGMAAQMNQPTLTLVSDGQIVAPTCVEFCGKEPIYAD